MIEEDKELKEDIRRAVAVLRDGGVILYPTDTIWGLGCDASNPEAVAKIYELKRRNSSKSMISLVDSIEALEKIVPDLTEAVKSLLNESREPLTVIYPDPDGIAENLKAENGSAAMRITHEKFSNLLCKTFGGPVVSTSANYSGEPFPSRFEEIDERLRESVDYVVSFAREKNERQSPSRIVKIEKDGEITVIRP